MVVNDVTYNNLLRANRSLKKKLDKFENDEEYKKIKKEKDYWKQRYYKKNRAWENKYNLLNKKLDRTNGKFNKELKKYTFWKTKKQQIRIDDDIKPLGTKAAFQEYVNNLKKEHDEIIRKKDKRIKELEEQVESLRNSRNKDFTNSNIPSSEGMRFKKVPNLREKSGKKVGGQIGHQGHKRKRLEPTEPPIELDVDKKFLDTSRYTETNSYKERDLVDLVFNVRVIRYRSKIFIDKKTGKRKWTAFPNGVVNETNYGETLKTFIFLQNNHCNVAIKKISDFIAYMTGKDITIADGTVCNYSKEFVRKSKKEIANLEEKLQNKDVLGCDFTNARCNGNNNHVFVATADDAIKYYARKKKGHDGIKGSVVEKFKGNLVHDHDKTFYHYGTDHQECLAHIMRNLKGIMQNEPGRNWPKQMFKSLGEIILARNQLSDNGPLPDNIIELSKKLYNRALELAQNEYKKHPPGKYNKEGVRLYNQLDVYKENVLLFLYDSKVPTTNNASERALRKVKRKMKQMTTFRSYDNFECYCDALSLLSTWALNDQNIYLRTKSIFAKA